MDHAGRIIDFNRAAERTFGYSREDAVGRRVSDLLVPAHMRDAHEQGLKRHLATGETTVLGQPLQLSALRADGTEFDAELTINRIDLREGPLFTASIRDVSAQRSAEERSPCRRAALPQPRRAAAARRLRRRVGRRLHEPVHEPADRGDARLRARGVAGRSDFLARVLHPDDLDRVWPRWQSRPRRAERSAASTESSPGRTRRVGPGRVARDLDADGYPC